MKKIKVLLSILLFFATCSVVFSQSTSETKEIGYIIFAPDTAIFENEVEAKILLDQYAKKINDIPSYDRQIHINGWTAIFDNDIDPIQLSTDRANVVLNELKLRGISEERLDIAKGNGGTSIFGNNNTPEERKLNRRVIISIDEISVIQAKVEPANVPSKLSEIPKPDRQAFKINWKKVLIAVLIIVAVVALVLLIVYVIIPAIGAGATAGAGAGGVGVAKGAKNIFGKIKNVFKSKPSNLKFRKPVDGVGGKFVGKKWKIDMNNIPKSGNDPIKPMTQRNLIKLNNDLLNGSDGKKIPEKLLNRLKKEYGNILKKDKLDISFKNGEPNFSKLSFEKIKINPTTRYPTGGVKGNMQMASEICSKKWGMSFKEFEDWRNRLQLVWHESKTGDLYLLPHNIHANIPHDGLIAQVSRL